MMKILLLLLLLLCLSPSVMVPSLCLSSLLHFLFCVSISFSRHDEDSSSVASSPLSLFISHGSFSFFLLVDDDNVVVVVFICVLFLVFTFQLLSP